MAKFLDIFEYQNKSRIKAGEGLEIGKYPFYTSSSEQSKRLNDFNFEGDSLIFGTGGDASVHFNNGKFSVSTDCLVAQPKTSKKIASKYYYYFLKGNIRILEKGFKGAGLKHISKGYIDQIDLPEADYQHQKKVVDVLDRADALRQQRKQSLQLLDDFLRATFLDMFGDPIRNGLKINKKYFGDLFTVKHGFAFKGEHFTNKGEYVLLTPGNFYEEGGYRDRGEKQKYYNGEIPEEYILREGDMLIAMTEQAPGLLGSPIIIPESNKFLHNQRLGLLVFKSHKVKKQFLFYLFNSKTVRQLIHMKGVGTKVRHTSPTKIEAIDIYVPSIGLQNKFVEIVDQTEKIKRNMRTSSADIDNQFNALTQEFFK